jgi:NAD(P)-dependent dehydrogenase (short-subunit alcohol dehydrogenase family)
MQTTQRIAVVTAAAGGIGQAIVRELLAQQHTVFALDYDHAALKRLSDKNSNDQLHPILCDATKPSAVAEAFKQIGQQGMLHVLVNGVGSTCSGGLRDLTVERWQYMFDLNLTSVLLCTQAALPLLETTPGDRVVVNISSALATVADHTTLAYGAFKAGLEQLTRSLALELAPLGARALAVAPGPVSETGGEATFDTVENTQLNPLARFATTKEIAALVGWLASPAATYITGTTIRIDGGDSALGIGWGPLLALRNQRA